jgi:phosphomannomutase
VDVLLEKLIDVYSNEEVNTIDGVKIILEKGWVHLRKSNTEPIIRIYAESSTKAASEQLAQEVINKIKELI